MYSEFTYKIIKMKTIAVLPILIMFFLISGCEKYLDVEPKGTVRPNTVGELGELIIGEYKFGYSNRSTAYMSDELVVLEADYTNLLVLHKNGYRWESLFNEGDVDLDWKDIYYKTYLTNYVLDMIDEADLNGSTEADRNRIKAEALTIRSYDYLQLVNIYGAHYHPETAASDMAVPLILRADISSQLPRSSVDEIYTQIISDLKTAINLFSSNAIPDVRINSSKTGAYGLLSRLYLFRSEWQKALEYANLALANYSVLYNYNNYTRDNSHLTRILNAQENQEAILYRTCTQSYTRGNKVIIADDLIDLFETNDLRFQFFTENNGNGTYAYWSSNSGDNFPMAGITVPELYLIRAETNARLGNIADAMNDLFILRSNRYDINAYPDQVSFEAAIALSATNIEEAIQLVLDERRKELMFTNLRWFDMKRLILEGRYTKTLTRTIRGENYTLEPDSYKYVIDISPDIKNRNPLL